MTEAFSKELKEIRRRYDISLRALAEESGLNYVYISRLENGVIKNPPKENLGKVAYGIQGLLGPTFETMLGDEFPIMVEMNQWMWMMKAGAPEGKDYDEWTSEIPKIDPEEQLAKAKEQIIVNIDKSVPIADSIHLVSEFYQTLALCLDFKKAKDFDRLLGLLGCYHKLNDSSRDLLKDFAKLLEDRQRRMDKRKKI